MHTLSLLWWGEDFKIMMTLKEIKGFFKVIKLTDRYALYDEHGSVYPNYRGSSAHPFIGCIKKKNEKFTFVYEGLNNEERVFKSISELNGMIADYISMCEGYGVTTDCCDIICNTVYKCEIAVIQFIRNNTELEIKDNSVTIGSTTIHLDSSKNKFRIRINMGDDVFMQHFFTDKFDALPYISSLLKVLLLSSISEPIKNIRKMSASNAKERYDLFDNDVLYKMDFSTFEIHHIGTLREQLINELECILQQLKKEK